jgi:hypothetical protein
MSPQCKELLFLIRQHGAFQEFLNMVETPEPKPYSPSKAGAVAEQNADWIFRSGRKAQHELWRSFLTENTAPSGA